MSAKIIDNKLYLYNPINKKNIGSIPITSDTEFQIILNNAKLESLKYNFSNFFDRQKIINQFNKGIISNLDKIINLICNETGKKYVEALMEVFISVEHIKRSKKNLYKALRKETRKVGILKSRKAWIEYEAIGTVGIISPWNYPLILVISPLVEALLAGNVVILKPSEHAPLTTQLIKQIWDEATGRPALFQPIYGDGNLGNTLVESSDINLICFTGSTKVGKKIATSCASTFKPVILELGGKDPMIILDDADIDRTIEAALWGGCTNAGQTCLSVERIFVQENIYKEVVGKLSELIKKTSAGYNNCEIGAITTELGFLNLKKQLRDIKIVSNVVQGNADEGFFIPPTLVIEPPFNSELFTKETFGPIMTIHAFKTIDDAIQLANNTGYGLSASIFGKNKKHIKFISRRLNVGTVSINDVLTHYGIADLPFGGMGLSGIGKVHGVEGLRAFSKQKAYMKTRIQLKSEFWWYKRIEKFENYIKKWIQWQYS